MRVLSCACVVVLLGGCSIFMRSIERPSAKVRDVSVSAAGLTGVSGELSLDVTNPSPIGVPLSGIDWELSIGGAPALTGSVQLSKTIPARGVVPVTTSLTIAAGDALAAGSALARGARDYQLVAHLRFSTAVGPLDIEVKHAGQLGGGGAASAVRSVLSVVH
jgi:hypothetical protein